MLTLTFAGATGTVTGSRFLLDAGDARFLLDCGLYQGGRELRDRNWQPFPVPPESVDVTMLSHAHIDHTGYLPRFVAESFAGPVYATPGTRDLCALLLPDSARLQEEEAEYRNRKGKSRHTPALPLYTEAEAERAVGRIRPVEYEAVQSLPGGARLQLSPAGHVLGSALVGVEAEDRSLLFTGDFGRIDPLLLAPPATVREADYLLLESTYGNRLHELTDPAAAVAEAVHYVVEHRGVLVIPAFAIGRTQEVLVILRELEDDGRIPSLPVAVDSPMATDATELYMESDEQLNDEARALGERAMCPRQLRFTRAVEQSKALNEIEGPAIIISASGMATGGRILHHLRRRLPEARNAVLLVGYQAEGSRGRQLQEGAEETSIFQEEVPVRAKVIAVGGLSAHGDASELIGWMRGFRRPPRRTFLVHGEDDARVAFAARIRDELGWEVHVPSYLERVTLD